MQGTRNIEKIGKGLKFRQYDEIDQKRKKKANKPVRGKVRIEL
jgi:hypothetical protein